MSISSSTSTCIFATIPTGTHTNIPETNHKVSKDAKIRNLYNQVPNLTQDTNGKVTNLQLDTKNESQEVTPFPAGDHKAHINKRSQRHSKHKTEKSNKSIIFISYLRNSHLTCGIKIPKNIQNWSIVGLLAKCQFE